MEINLLIKIDIMNILPKIWKQPLVRGDSGSPRVVDSTRDSSFRKSSPNIVKKLSSAKFPVSVSIRPTIYFSAYLVAS